MDVTFDLETGKYWPYRKPNNEPLYIHSKSNHPPSIIKHIPQSISSRIASISCDEESFLRAKPVYEEALKKGGHATDFRYASETRKQRKPRKRNVLWFNPPFNLNVKTNVARQFLKMIDKHFPRHHRYHKLFNRSNVKCSYSCMSNMSAIISNHNAKTLATATEVATRTCNCRNPQSCPLDGKCLSACVVYKATVSTDSKPVRHYYGLTEGQFKTRYNAHTHSFRSEHCRRETELSKYIWDLKDQHQPYAIRWEVVQRAAPYKAGSRRCDICISEKLAIATADPRFLLNKRAEIISTCRHRAKFRYHQVTRGIT